MSRSESSTFCIAVLAALLSLVHGTAFAQTASAEITSSIQAPPRALAPPPQPAAIENGAASAAPQGTEQRVALVIGNSRYRNASPLPNPDNDAQSIAQLLNSAGFEVVTANDLTQNDMIGVVQDFTARVAARGPNTVAMVYYAGHGVQLEGENYLIPVDAKVSSPLDLVNSSVRLVDILATLEAIPSRVRIVVLDACRDNPFPSVVDAGRGLAIADAPSGSIVGYSTAPGTEALDGSNGHSPYTSAFLRLAREPDLPIEQLFKRVRLEVNHATDGEQTPWESSSLTSEFYFFGDTAVAAGRAPARGPIMQTASNLPMRSVQQAYDYVVAEDSPEDYQEFLQMFPHDPLCERIRVLLSHLVLATAWHQAVLANSPLGYKDFYDKHANSAYALSALKLQSQPRIVPVMQPTRLIVPPNLKFSSLFNSLGPSRYNAGALLETTPTRITTPPADGTGKSTTPPAGTVGATAANQNLKQSNQNLKQPEPIAKGNDTPNRIIHEHRSDGGVIHGSHRVDGVVTGGSGPHPSGLGPHIAMGGGGPHASFHH
jgi:Caspase domain